MDNGRAGPGLPRTFVDDPFFGSNSEFLRDFPPPSHRRFGSSPRLLEDDESFFQSPFDDPTFHSLPRRNAPLRHSGRASPNSQSSPSAGVERPIHVQRQTTVPQQSQPAQKSALRTSQKESPPQQTANVPKITVTEPIVEINNPHPSSYTNGQLNPDKRERAATVGETDAQSQNSASNHEAKRGSVGSIGSTGTTVTVSGAALNKEMPSDNGAAAENSGFQRKFGGDGCSEQLIHLLDEAERRVEQLRETANQMEQEKEQLLDIISNVKLNAEILRLGQGERDDINATAERILKRCRAVDVVVNTPRNQEQSKALEDVNGLIQGVLTKMQDDLASSKETVRRFLNACSPEEPNGPIDQRFQAKVVECTADDQKKIRRKLAQLITQIDRAERACQPIV